VKNTKETFGIEYSNMLGSDGDSLLFESQGGTGEADFVS
jgi:hypothetical protein